LQSTPSVQVELAEAKDEDPDAAAAYEFFLAVAGEAWTLYEKWKSHSKFRGTRIRAIERDGGKIVEVPDGIISPSLGRYQLSSTAPVLAGVSNCRRRWMKVNSSRLRQASTRRLRTTIH